MAPIPDPGSAPVFGKMLPNMDFGVFIMSPAETIPDKSPL